MKDRFTLLLLGLIVVLLAGLCLRAGGKGCVVLATPGAQLQLRSLFGRHMMLESGSEPTAIPARAYRPASLALTWNQDGDTWKVSSVGPWGKLVRIQVERGRTTTIEVGPPLLVKPKVDIGHGRVLVSLGLFGRSGEKYENVVLRNSQRIPGPQVKIIDEAGTVLASGQFQYG